MRTQQMLLAVLTLFVCSSMTFAGTVSGKVTYTGTPERQKPINMDKEPYCAKQHTKPATFEAVVTGPNNGLENVVVYVSSGAPDDGQIPTQGVTLEQKGCQYIPHVLVMHTNQELKIVNDDQATHNIHPQPKVNRESNNSQAPGAAPIVEKYAREEFISVKCNVHPWMHGYFVVLKTNHYDVSKGGGSFKLPNLPPGKYTLTAWHEEYGTQTAEVTITGNEIKNVNFIFKAEAH